MPTPLRTASLVVTAALVTTLAVAAAVISTGAHAQAPRVVVCTTSPVAYFGKNLPQLQSWMQEQLAAGKTDFMPMASAQGLYGACAW